MKKIVLIGPRSGCGYTTAARELLKQKKTSYSNYYIKMSELDKFRGIFSNLKMTKTSRITVPIIFVDGKHLSGGYEDLKKLFGKKIKPCHPTCPWANPTKNCKCPDGKSPVLTAKGTRSEGYLCKARKNVRNT